MRHTLLLLIVLCLSGTACATLKVERDASAPQTFGAPPTLHLELIDNSGVSPVLPDAYLNKLWTPGGRRQNRAERAAAKFQEALEDHQFTFLDSPDDAEVLAELEIRGVRFDPIAGWITDGASIHFELEEHGTPIGRVTSRKAAITPTVGQVVDRLVKGFLILFSVP